MSEREVIQRIAEAIKNADPNYDWYDLSPEDLALAAHMAMRQIERDAARVAITAPEGFDLRPGAVNRVEDGGLVREITKKAAE